MKRTASVALGLAVCTACSDSPRSLQTLLLPTPPATYEAVDLGTLAPPGDPGGGRSHATDINDLGQVVGYSLTGGEPRPYGEMHAFFWENGVMTDLGTLDAPGRAWSTALFINAAGQVTGVSNVAATERHPFLWQDGVMQDLGTLGGTWGEPRGINIAGQVVGYSTTATGESHAFLWQSGGMQDLGTLGGPSSDAHSINAVGQVVGEATTATGETHAFLWDSGVLQDLGTLGGTFSTANAINAHGQVTGESTDLTGVHHAFLWEQGVMNDLGTLPGYVTSSGSAVTALGAVAGITSTATGTQHGFFWEMGAMYDIGTLGGTRTWVLGVNPRGQVVGVSFTCGNIFCAQAYSWEDGVITRLPALPGHRNANAAAVNTRGDVVGESSLQVDSDLRRAVLWRRAEAGVLAGLP